MRGGKPARRGSASGLSSFGGRDGPLGARHGSRTRAPFVASAQSRIVESRVTARGRRLHRLLGCRTMPFAGGAIVARLLSVLATLDGSAWVACSWLLLLLLLAPNSGELVPQGPWRFVLGFALPVGAGLAWAWQLRWVADDAFITFRYADNFAHGFGPVWNRGGASRGTLTRCGWHCSPSRFDSAPTPCGRRSPCRWLASAFRSL